MKPKDSNAPKVEIKALRRITDGGHNVKAGAVEAVEKPYADEWCNRGWAEVTTPKATK